MMEPGYQMLEYGFCPIPTLQIKVAGKHEN